MALAHSSGSMAGVGPTGATVAALFTRMPASPSPACTRAAMRRGPSGSPISAWISRALRPAARTPAAASASSGPVRATQATWAPARARSMAVARPMPRPASVTIATWPSSRPDMTISIAGWLPPQHRPLENLRMSLKQTGLYEQAGLLR